MTAACGFAIEARGVIAFADLAILKMKGRHQPDAARELLHFRHRTLALARQRAIEMSQRGALFPWRTINGEEASAYYPAGTAQYHIDSDVAYAIDRYVTATGDTEFLYGEAARSSSSWTGCSPTSGSTTIPIQRCSTSTG